MSRLLIRRDAGQVTSDVHGLLPRCVPRAFDGTRGHEQLSRHLIGTALQREHEEREDGVDARSESIDQPARHPSEMAPHPRGTDCPREVGNARQGDEDQAEEDQLRRDRSARRIRKLRQERQEEDRGLGIQRTDQKALLKWIP